MKTAIKEYFAEFTPRRKKGLKLGVLLLIIGLFFFYKSPLYYKIPLSNVKTTVPLVGQYETTRNDKKGTDTVKVTVCYSRRVRGTWENIMKSAKALDGLEIGPGDEFSWLEYVGKCTKEDGYVLGGGFDGMEYGGGICFTATAFFRFMYTVKEIDEGFHTKAYAHHQAVWYAPDRNDATIDADHNVDLTSWNTSTKTLSVKVKINKRTRCITFIGTIK